MSLQYEHLQSWNKLQEVRLNNNRGPLDLAVAVMKFELYSVLWKVETKEVK